MKTFYITLFILFQAASVALGQNKTVNVKTYGAIGDGVSNDYPALKKAVAQINAQGGGELYFPPGNYYLDVYHIPIRGGRGARPDQAPSSVPQNPNDLKNGAPPAPDQPASSNRPNSPNRPAARAKSLTPDTDANIEEANLSDADISKTQESNPEVTDLEFKNCDGLRIYGDQATIAVKGNIIREVTRINERHTFSSIMAITPIKLSNCKNVVVEGLTLDGNVDQMRKDPKVNESGGHLLFINKSENVQLKNLYIHHAQTDGIYIRNFSKDVTADNVVSSNNARQGMSIIQLERGVFNNCKFINTGITEGPYGRHAPSGGVDIEPNRQTEQVLDIQFNNCLFANNRGPQFIVSHPGTTNHVVLRSCKFVADEQSNKLGILVSARDVLFEDCFFELGKANIYPARKPGTSSVFRNCIIRSSSSGIIAINADTERSVVVDRCTLEYTGYNKISSYFPYINMRNMVFTNNIIKVPSQYCKDSGSSGMVMNSMQVSGNRYLSEGRDMQQQLSVKGSRVRN